MAKPYWYQHDGGFVRDGNRLHRDEIKSINAQLALGYKTGTGYLRPHESIVGTPSTRKEPYRLDNNSTIRERLKGRADIFQKLAQLTIGSLIPESWKLSSGNQELDVHHKQQRSELIQSLGELSVEAGAA